MNVRAFLVGLSIGVVVAVAPSCGTTTKKCLRSNCAGCCDQNDECQSGTAAFACGTDGRTCSSCMPGQSCGAGVCVGGAAGGGSAGGGSATGGGNAGGAALCANCNGCCDNGACRGGNTFTACGVGGAACQNCQSQNKACNTMGQCIAFVCPGCVTDAGACTPGNSNLACGSDAGVCSQCASNQSCFAGACVTATACSPANCGGCCGTMCVQTPSAMNCGAGGNPCVTCGGGLVCTSGSCVSGAGGGSATGGGSAGVGGGISGVGGGLPGGCQLTCLTGCCDGLGQCKPGNSRSECGNLAENCRVCTGLFGCIPQPITGGGFCG